MNRASEPGERRLRSTLQSLTTVAHDEARHWGPLDDVPTGPAFVRDVMTTDVIAAHDGALFKEIVDTLSRHRISAVPVVDTQRRVVGIVSESDLLARISGGELAHPRGHRLTWHREERAKFHAATARELMTSPAVVTTPGTPIGRAARDASHARVRRLPVVDGQGMLVGIVTRADLLRPFLRPDDEICADIEHNVVVGGFLLDSHQVQVCVHDGVVTLLGHLERRLLADSLAGAIAGVSGVIDVDATGLTYRVDDTRVPPLIAPY